MQLITQNWDIHAQEDGFVIERAQEITAEHIKRIQDHKHHSAANRAGELHWAASVPVIFAYKWLNEGFDVFRAPLKEVKARLIKEGLDHFIASNKI